jgi:hypothetical protein
MVFVESMIICVFSGFTPMSQWVIHCYNNLHYSNEVLVSRVKTSLVWQCYTLESRCFSEVALS